METIGNRIRKEREKKGLKQSDLAKAINKSAATITHIENGEHKGTFEMLSQICIILNVSADYLIFGKEDVREEELSEQGKQLLKEYKKFLKEHHPAEIRKIGNL